MTDCPAIDPFFQPHRDEFCPADSDFPDLPVEHIDVLISSIGFVFAVAVQLLSTHDKATLVGGTCRVVSEHFRYLLIVYVAYERRLSGAIRVAFDLMFPVHNLSLALYPRLTYPILMFLGFPSNFVSGCAAVFAWSTLLYVVAAACLLARQREDAFKRVSVFNILAVPDVQLAVSAGFAHWGRTTSYVQGTCCFAVSWYWSFFSILIPLIFLTNNPGLDRTAHIYEYDFRGGMKYWLIAVKTMQVVLIYGIHFLKIYFRALPGYAFVVLLLLVFMYRQLQTTYWPYKLRSLNFIADDTYLSLILMSAWARYRLDYIAAVAFCLPLRQAWRLFEFRFKRSHRSTPVLQAEEQKDNQPLGRRRKRRSKF